MELAFSGDEGEAASLARGRPQMTGERSRPGRHAVSLSMALLRPKALRREGGIAGRRCLVETVNRVHDVVAGCSVRVRGDATWALMVLACRFR